MAINKNLWEPRRIIELRYFRSLDGIVDLLQKAIAGETDPYQIVKILKSALIGPVFTRYAEETAAKMITHLFTDNARTWREAAREAGKGRVIYEALQRELQGPIGGMFYGQIQRNAAIIKTLPDDIASQVTGYIEKESLKGRRASDIADDIQKMFPESSTAKAQLIARTEVSKTSTALTRARAENISLPWYEWRTSEDGRVRSSHRHMDRVLINWDDPPSPEALEGIKSQGKYHAGDIFNCRCYPAPLTGIDRVAWPHKVYAGGRIVTMTRAEFELLNRGGVMMTA